MAKHPKKQGTVLVTGGAKRIGKAICLSLSSKGYTIALHYNDSFREAEQCAAAIIKTGGQCHLFHCDLSDEAQTAQLISDVYKNYPDLNLLINNASIFTESTIKNSDFESIHKNFSINFYAPFILTTQFAKKCKKGQIINILDTHVVKNSTKHAAYLLSKKSLHELTKLSAVELAPNIRVNAVSPGLILPPIQSKPDYVNRLAKKIPLKKKGNVEQITQSIDFLIDNTYITGQVIFNDGGEHLI